MSKRLNAGRYRPYPDTNLCPCDSGLLYTKCCKKKKFKFKLDGRGKVHRQLEVHPRLNTVLEEAALEFQQIFGRKPGPKDPVVFNHWLSGEEDFWEQARTVGRTANTPEQLIFAWRRSGFIVGEHSRQLMPDNEYQEWADAIDEYFAIKDGGFDPFHVFTCLSGEEYETYKALVSKFEHVIIGFGFALTNPKRFSHSADYFRYLFIQRALSSLRTINEMYNKRYDGDCLSIARTLYEAYLRMKLLRLNPSSAERFEAALAYQTGVYKPKQKKDGKPNFDIVLDPETGKEFKITIFNREIIEISDFPLEEQFYYDLYPLLSGFVHPDLLTVAFKSVATEEGNQPREEDPIQSAIFVSSICVLLLLEIGQSNFLRRQTKRDIKYILKAISDDLLKLIISDTVVTRHIAFPSLYRLFGLKVQTTESP